MNHEGHEERKKDKEEEGLAASGRSMRIVSFTATRSRLYAFSPRGLTKRAVDGTMHVIFQHCD